MIHVIGAGLAGSEAAWQIARLGVPVTLWEMKPQKYSPAHKSAGFAELVCSNSLRADGLTNAVGLLKEEMRRLDSLVLRAADATRVPAGGSLSVDRDAFSAYITGALESEPLITIRREEATQIPEAPVIVATGPLTSDAMAASIRSVTGIDSLSFFDAAAPVVFADSLQMQRIFRASRYDKGEDDYLNCPMNREEYESFIDALLSAETAPVHGFEGQVFEGCMPVEVMANRGRDTLRFGPLKPVGLQDPATGKMPYAVLQLRQENAAATLYNLVGFQTRLKFGEQKRVFGMIPGLETAQYARYGVMHRNTFLNSPQFLGQNFRFREQFYFAGQMTGVEGYVESAASGLLAGLAAAREQLGKPSLVFPDTTALGALSLYVTLPSTDFQPMHINFGLIAPLPQRIRNKQQKYALVAERALATIDSIAAGLR